MCQAVRAITATCIALHGAAFTRAACAGHEAIAWHGIDLLRDCWMDMHADFFMGARRKSVGINSMHKGYQFNFLFFGPRILQEQENNNYSIN